MCVYLIDCLVTYFLHEHNSTVTIHNTHCKMLLQQCSRLINYSTPNSTPNSTPKPDTGANDI